MYYTYIQIFDYQPISYVSFHEVKEVLEKNHFRENL